MVAYPADLDLFEMWSLVREFTDKSWEKPRIYLYIADQCDYIQLEDTFTNHFSFVFDHTDELHFKCFCDPQFNDHGNYVLGYVSIKVPNKFVKELVIKTAYLNGYRYRTLEGFPFHKCNVYMCYYFSSGSVPQYGIDYLLIN